MRALVVDDSLAIRKLISRILDGIGWEVMECSNGEEALAAIKRHGACDIAFIDWHMPLMGGIDLLKKINENYRCADMKLVMVTTESEMSRMNQAFDEGVEEYITKPFSPEQLIETVTRLFPS